MPSTHRLSPRKSLQKLRTAFSSHSPTRRAEPDSLSPLSTTTTTASTSSSTTSPSTSPTPDQHPFASFAGFSFGNGSPVFPAAEDFHFSDQPQQSEGSGLSSRRVIRRKKSCVEIEQEQERCEFDGALVGIVEPRPRFGPALGGIEEVLCGEV
ncbi:hypothetical protein Q7P37_001324 [Cladosporium fusiforme]